MASWLRARVIVRHQEKKSVSERTGCVRTHQALGRLWMHPGRAPTTPNAKRTGNVNSDAACHGTVHSDAICQGAVRLDAARHGICLPDGACQGIFLLAAAVSEQMASGRRVSWHHGHAVCQGTEYRSKYCCRIREHAAGSRHTDSVQVYSFYLMYIYICYYHTSRGNKGKLANTTRRDEHNAMSTTR